MLTKQKGRVRILPRSKITVTGNKSCVQHGQAGKCAVVTDKININGA